MCIKLVMMMDEKKKYIDIDEVVGDLDEVTIKDLRNETGLSRQEFCDNFDIPYRTLQSWELGDREMPAFAKRLMAYIIAMKQMEEKAKKRMEQEGEAHGEENN